MPINIRDKDLESRIEVEKSRRGDKTTSGTTRKLLVERLTQIESDAARQSASTERPVSTANPPVSETTREQNAA